VIIETQRLILRRLARYDAPALHSMFSDAESMQFWSSLPHKDPSETEAWVEESIATMARGDAHDFAVLREGKVVGRVAFWMGNEIGFIFDRAVWGQGIAREAVGALLRYGFETLGFTSVRADVDPENLRSVTLLERLGFQRTGYAERTFKLGERWTDSVYLELAATDFRSAPTVPAG
jgi:ribosomal-protein-alanine N-acetyltransferase